MLLTMTKNGVFLSITTSKPLCPSLLSLTILPHIHGNMTTHALYADLSCRMLFELLVLSGAQVGSDWTSILKKRQNFRLGFASQAEKIPESIDCRLIRLTYRGIFLYAGMHFQDLMQKLLPTSMINK